MILMQSDVFLRGVVTNLRLQIRVNTRLVAALLGLCAFPFSAIAITCDEWFEKLKLEPSSVSCVADCTRAGDKAADANKEFYCTPYCRGLCVPDKKGCRYGK